MVDVPKINLNDQTYSSQSVPPTSKEEDLSLFHGEEFYSVELLKNQLSDVESKNGFIRSAWDDVKNTIKLGVSSDDCEDAIEQYKQGKISYEEAEAKINKYKDKQDSSLNLFSNIATGVVAIVAGTAMTAATGGAAAPIAVGMVAGAVTKASTKTADRATNEVEKDALDGKQIAKDALSGAVTGGISVATAGTGGNAFQNGFSLAGKKLVNGGTKACMANSTVIGLKSGAVSGASNNLIECAFEEDKKFNLKNFATETVTNSLTGGVVGTVMGGFNGTLRTNNLLHSGGSVSTANTAKDVFANSVCSTEYKIVTDTARRAFGI